MALFDSFRLRCLQSARDKSFGWKDLASCAMLCEPCKNVNTTAIITILRMIRIVFTKRGPLTGFLI